MTHATVIIPTLNEAQSIEAVLRRIVAVTSPGDEYVVIVVDDGSSDGTCSVVEKLAESLPVKLMVRPRQGLASAVLEGVSAAKTPIVVVMDADGSHPPERVADLVRTIVGGAQVAIGSRYVEGGESDDACIRRFFSIMATLPCRWLTGVRDPLSGFFAIRREILLEAGKRAAGYKVLLEVLCHLPRDAKVVEIPIRFAKRKHGKSKLTLEVQLKFLCQLARLCVNRMLRFK